MTSWKVEPRQSSNMWAHPIHFKLVKWAHIRKKVLNDCRRARLLREQTCEQITRKLLGTLLASSFIKRVILGFCICSQDIGKHHSAIASRTCSEILLVKIVSPRHVCALPKCEHEKPCWPTPHVQANCSDEAL